jgi:PIN domain nuclease of toxin-antitoxin system
VISVWEIAMLVARARLRLTMQIEEWVRRALGAPGIGLAELTPSIAIESTRLPGDPPRDPADRILLATALVHGASFATCDRRILRYVQRGGPSVLDANV